MKSAEQVRNVYGQVQMWKAIYCYIISTKVNSQLSFWKIVTLWLKKLVNK